jgi:hypothetical protein
VIEISVISNVLRSQDEEAEVGFGKQVWAAQRNGVYVEADPIMRNTRKFT